MQHLNKRTLLKTAALSAIALAALAGCGKKEEAAAPAAAPAPAAAAPAADKLKIAFMYVSPIGDGGWTFQHDLGRKAIQEKFGDKIETSFVESVPESADAERVMRDMAGQGNQLIFATSFGYQEFVQKVAADLPDVKFEHATGFATGGIHIEQDAGDTRVGQSCVEHRADLAIGRKSGRCFHAERATNQRAVDRNHGNTGGRIRQTTRGRNWQRGFRIWPADAITQHRQDDVELGTGDKERRPVQTGRQMR